MPYRASSPHCRAAHLRSGLSTLAIAAALACALPAGNAIAQADTTTALNIAAQPLGQALLQLGQQSDIHIYYQPELVRGQTAPAVNGTLSPRQALAQLLAGSGLVADVNGKEVVIRRAPPASRQAATLPEVVVLAPATAPGITEGTGSYTTGSTSAATGLNLSLRETPQSVTVVTRQRLDDQNLNSLKEVMVQIPGVSVIGGSSLASSALTNIMSRGYDLNRYQIDGATVSPFTFTTGGSGGSSALGLDMALYDSVAVVRGPTGLLSGDGDPSGSINLTRKRPTDTFQASLAGTLGRWDQYRAVADLGGPLNAAGTVRGRVVALHDESKSWVDRQTYDRNVGYAVLDADLGKDTLLSLALEHYRNKTRGGAYAAFPFVFDDLTVTPFSRSDNPTADWSYEDQKKTVASLALEHRFNDDWQAKARYSHSTIETSGKYGTILGINSDGSISRFRPSLTISPRTTQSHEWDLRLNGSFTLFAQQHDVVAGFNGYSTRKTEHMRFSRFSTSTANTLNPFWNGSYPEPDWSQVPLENETTKIEQYGAFLATRLRPTDNLSVILGTRLTTWKTNTFDRVSGVTTDDRKESSVFTPYVGVVYDLSGWLSAYASYTQIFNPQNYKDVNGRFLDPEKGKNYELGLKGEWFDGRLNASVAVFETRKDNLAVSIPGVYTPDGDFAYSAESGTKGRGWELEVSGEPVPGWQVQGGYARIVTKDADGIRMNTHLAPRHSFKLFTTWKPAQVQGLTVGGGLLWQSELDHSYWGALYPEEYTPEVVALMRQKSYAVANLLVQYRFNDHLNLSVNLNNVFNKTYRTAGFYHDYGAPRNLQATLRYQF